MANLLREERLDRIVEKLEQDQRLSSTDIMEKFGVSEGTVRRDLNELEERGLLKKVHGGAVPRPDAPKAYENRKEFVSERKENLTRKALSLLKNGQLIFIDGGSTNWNLARQFPPKLSAVVFTNSLPVAQTLLNHANIELHILGGRVFKESQVTEGSHVVESIRYLQADICFVGIRSIHAEKGLSTLDFSEARVKQAMVENSNQVVTMATIDKLNTADHYKICETNQLDILITEEHTPSEKMNSFHNLGIDIW